jgi:hypothetical protein
MIDAWGVVAFPGLAIDGDEDDEDDDDGGHGDGGAATTGVSWHWATGWLFRREGVVVGGGWVSGDSSRRRVSAHPQWGQNGSRRSSRPTITSEAACHAKPPSAHLALSAFHQHTYSISIPNANNTTTTIKQAATNLLLAV